VGDDRAGCTEDALCRTWAAAYQRAAPGDHIVLAGGNYGDVELRRLARKASPATPWTRAKSHQRRVCERVALGR
jgi:hypothetical protein